VRDAAPRGEPLDVAVAEAGRGAEGVGMVDQPAQGDGDRLEAAVRVRGESGNGRAVIHVPALRVAEVVAERTAGQGGVGTEARVAARVVVGVVGREEEGVEALPGRAELEGFDGSSRGHRRSLHQCVVVSHRITLQRRVHAVCMYTRQRGTRAGYSRRWPGAHGVTIGKAGSGSSSRPRNVASNAASPWTAIPAESPQASRATSAGLAKVRVRSAAPRSGASVVAARWVSAPCASVSRTTRCSSVSF